MKDDFTTKHETGSKFHFFDEKREKLNFPMQTNSAERRESSPPFEGKLRGN